MSGGRIDTNAYDPRLIDALRKFARHEIALFSTPYGLSDDLDYEDNLPGPLIMRPSDPQAFKRLAACLAIHRLDTPVVSYDEAYLEEEEGSPYAIDAAALASGDEPIFDVETAEAAALEAAEATGPAHHGARAIDIRTVLIRATPDREPNLDDIERFARDALSALTRAPEEIADEAPELARFSSLFAAMRNAPRRTEAVFEPKIDLVYVFGGVWRSSARAEAALTVRVADLQAGLPGAKVKIHIWGEAQLIAAYERVALAAVGVLRHARLIELPRLAAGETPAHGWIGYAPASALVELIQGHDGAPDPRLFYDNVRHYLGDNARENPGAAGLERTLAAGEASEVVLRHNGVTIVARGAELEREQGMESEEADLLLRDFQIVNGAQTVFTLTQNEHLLDGASLPVKVVVTEDERVKDGVVLGANTQSAVDRYDMLARRPELRALQQAFDAAPPSAPEKLWLQRRRAEPFRERVNPQRVVTPRQVLEGFAATLMGAPHRSHDAASALLEEVPSKIFAESHEPTAYLAVGWLIVAGRRWAERHQLRWADRVGEGRADAYPARFQFLYALYRLVDRDPDDQEITRGGAAAVRFRAVSEVFATRDGAALADLAGVIVREAAGGKALTSDLARRSSFTEAVRSLTDEARARLHGLD